MKPLITLLLEIMIWGWSRQPNQLNKLQSTHTYTHTIRRSKIHDPIIINLINGSTKKKSNLNCPRLLIFLFLWYHCFKCCCYWERNTTFSNLFPSILKLWETYLKQNQKKQNSNDQNLITYGCIYNNNGSFYLMYQMLLMMRIARNTPKYLTFKELRVDWEDKK